MKIFKDNNTSWSIAMKSQIYMTTIMFLASCNFVFAQVNLSDSLVGYWKLDGNAIDSSTNNFDGTIFGAVPSMDRFGIEGGAMDFDGVNDYISIEHDEQLSLDTTYSISVWYNARSWDVNFAGQFISLLCKGTQQSPSGTNYQLNLGIVSGVTRVSGGPSCEVAPTDSIFLNQWQNIIYIRKSDSLKVYIDGNLVFSDLVCDGFGTNMGSLEFGRNVPGVVEYLDGSLDDIRIYDRALTTDEVAVLSGQNTTSTKSYLIDNNIQIYPNPVSDGRVRVKLGGIKSDSDEVSLNLYSIQGQELTTVTIISQGINEWNILTPYKGMAVLTLSTKFAVYSRVLFFH